MPFKEASDYLEKLLKISVSEETIETYVKHIGKAISVDEKEMVSKTIDSDGYVKEKILKKEFSASCESPKKTGAAYMQLDGTMVQTREEQWKEVRNGLIFSQKDMLQVDKHHKKIANKVYFSTFNHKDTSLQQFKNRATQVAHDFEFHRYEKPVVLGDGARWIWDYVDQCHPDAIQILDYYHANEYLGNAFKSLTFANNDEDKKQKNILQKLWLDRKSTRLNSSHIQKSRMPSSA